MKLRLPSLTLLAATGATALVASLALTLSTPTALVVDGQRVAVDVGPVTSGGVAYLPIAAVATSTGADAHYDAASDTITIRRGAELLRAKVGQTTAEFDGREFTLAHAPFVVRGEALLAGDDVERALGARVRYDERRARIDVRTPGVVVAGAADDEP